MTNRALQTQFSQREDSPGLLLWRISTKWQTAQRAALKPFNLTHTQFVLLASLTFAAGEHEVTQKQLSDNTEVDLMTTSQVLRKLEQKKLIERRRSSSDARAVIIEPTTEGIQLANRAVKVVEAVDNQFFGSYHNGLVQILKEIVASR